MLPGIEVHVLGPAFDEDVIRDMDPERAESYLQFLMTRSTGWETSSPVQLNGECVCEYRRTHTHLMFTEKQIKELANIGDGSEFDLATKLEKAVNGTSLLLMFDWPRELLFPGTRNGERGKQRWQFPNGRTCCRNRLLQDRPSRQPQCDAALVRREVSFEKIFRNGVHARSEVDRHSSPAPSESAARSIRSRGAQRSEGSTRSRRLHA